MRDIDLYTKSYLNSDFEVYATDIDYSSVALTKGNAQRAGVFKQIKVSKMNALDIKGLDRRATVVW